MTSIILKRVNNHTVDPIQVKIDTRPVRGGDLCSDVYANIFLVAPTNSGKTTAMFKLMKECIGKKTTIVAFVSTLFNDENWLAIREYFEKKGIEFIAHTSIVENGVNHLEELVEELKNQAIEREEEKERKGTKEDSEPVDLIKLMQQTNGVIKYIEEGEETEVKKKKKKSKYQEPEYVVVFDDLASEIKSNYFSTLLKSARHFHIKTITSSQYLKDMQASARAQIRLLLVFAGQSKEKLMEIHQFMELRMPFDLFYFLYKRATTPTKKSGLRPFFYIYPKKDDYRISFNTRFVIPENILHGN